MSDPNLSPCRFCGLRGSWDGGPCCDAARLQREWDEGRSELAQLRTALASTRTVLAARLAEIDRDIKDTPRGCDSLPGLYQDRAIVAAALDRIDATQRRADGPVIRENAT